MFFSGDSSARKRVDLGGRSSKESDRQVLLEQARLDRKRRLELRQQTSAAIKIQKCFRGRKDVKMTRSKVREQFKVTFGAHGEKANWQCFGPDSEFLPQLLFFTSNNSTDVTILVEACRLLLQYVQQNGNIVSLFSGLDYSSQNHSLVDFRVKKLAYACLHAIFHNRNQWKDNLLVSSTYPYLPVVVLFETVTCLTAPALPWNCTVIDYLSQRKVFLLLRCIILTGLHDVKTPLLRGSVSSLEHVLISLASHVGQEPCYCSSVDQRWSFSLQILSIPFLWHHLPFFKEVFWANHLGRHYMHQMADFLPNHSSIVLNDVSQEYPGHACLLGNLTEAAGVVLSDLNSSSHTAIDFLTVSTFLLGLLPCMDESPRQSFSPFQIKAMLPVLVWKTKLEHGSFIEVLHHLLQAMYEGILVDIPFATFFLSKLKEKSNFLHDLPSLDPELYRHLLFLKHYKGDVSELELYFVVVKNEYGEQTEEELIPGGKDMRVTNDNVISFIHLVANYRLNYQIRIQSLHFLRGFQQLIQKEWIEMFNEHEIQLLISGSLDSMDVDDLRSNTHYAGGYHHDHDVIVMFWEVLKSFSLEYQKKFLKFVTGCSRGPLLGFKYLEPKFCIQRAAPFDVAEEDLDRLPTSATCMNLLKLPPYQTTEQMRTKLVYAISADAGFDLS
ncbi:E3 ubiquitin-protein ligase UPL6-like [Zingiber officinale]|nr:E3 ubiquitin-protein ligase UPL6-like [Zingiber officinale]